MPDQEQRVSIVDDGLCGGRQDLKGRSYGLAGVDWRVFMM